MKTPLQQAEELFHRALDLPATERAAFLANASAGQAELHAQVEALLQAHERGGGFLPTEAGGPAVIAIPPESPAMEAGQVIGRYKLLQKIGEGGCGVVFVAEQAEPVRRRVALKIIKLGMDTRQVIARFEAERQALALMDHPNIAKVLDGGATENGRPYFVMELVRGVPITDYCDQACLTTVQRIDLFIQVCQAVQHAHQKGIIHRDLKPSNILVTVNDGIAVPKVIDFGIAKATAGQPLTDKTVFTAFEQFIGTPAYMSPEQALMTSLDIDTRSDIYALGVLLYELLTGRTPFDARALLTAGLDELRRTILETDPARPSARLSSLAQGELTTAAKRRATVAPRLIHSMQGDLDWIVMKCLEKDRSRRYETANGLAADLQRHLANEPVVARPPNAVYKVQKAIRRNRLVFAAGASVVVALGLGLGAAVWQYAQKTRAYDQARAEAERASKEAAKSAQTVKFLQDMLQGAGPLVALGRDTTILREILDKTAQRIDTEPKDEPEVEASLRLTLAWVYFTINERTKAESMSRMALAIRKQAHGNRHLLVAAALRDLATVVDSHPEAENLLRESLSIRKELAGDDDREFAWLLSNLSTRLEPQNKLDEAAECIARAISLKQKLPEATHLDIAMSFVNLGNVRLHQDKLPEAEAAYREALAIHAKLPAGETSGDALSLNEVAAGNLALVLERQGRFPEMEAPLRTALAAVKKLYGSESTETVYAFLTLGGAILRTGKWEDADRLIAATLQDMSSERLRLALRTRWAARRGRWQEAVDGAVRRVELDRDKHLPYHDLAPLLVQVGDRKGYQKHCQKEVDRFRDTQDANVAERMAKDCLILPDAGVDLNVVSAWAEVAVRAGEGRGDLPWFQFVKGLAEYRRGRFAEAAEWMQTVLRQHARDEHRDVQATAVLAMAQHRLGQTDTARATLAQADRLGAHLPRLESGNIGDGWVDWIIAQALWREASGLIQGTSVASPTGQAPPSPAEASP